MGSRAGGAFQPARGRRFANSLVIHCFDSELTADEHVFLKKCVNGSSKTTYVSPTIND